MQYLEVQYFLAGLESDIRKCPVLSVTEDIKRKIWPEVSIKFIHVGPFNLVTLYIGTYDFDNETV